jgi:hypothetical protein
MTRVWSLAGSGAGASRRPFLVRVRGVECPVCIRPVEGSTRTVECPHRRRAAHARLALVALSTKGSTKWTLAESVGERSA